MKRIPLVTSLLVIIALILLVNLLTTENERRYYRVRFNRFVKASLPKITEVEIKNSYTCYRKERDPDYSKKLEEAKETSTEYKKCEASVPKSGEGIYSKSLGCLRLLFKELEGVGVDGTIRAPATCEKVVAKFDSEYLGPVNLDSSPSGSFKDLEL